MVFYTILNVILIASIYFIFGFKVLLSYLLVALIGILLLETVNYIEHYGLLRKKNEHAHFSFLRVHNAQYN